MIDFFIASSWFALLAQAVRSRADGIHREALVLIVFFL
jgi:hypothetical protein